MLRCLASLFHHDIICLTKTKSIECCEVPALPQHECFSAFQPLLDGSSTPSSWVSVYVSDRLKRYVELVKTAADDTYLWLKLKHLMLDCPKLYFCARYMPQNWTMKDVLVGPFE